MGCDPMEWNGMAYQLRALSKRLLAKDTDKFVDLNKKTSAK